MKDPRPRPYQSFRKPRCVMVYALAPGGMPASEANDVFNDFIADRALPQVIYHDHFIGSPGGVAIFYVANAQERAALYENDLLEGWRVEHQPLIFSYNPAAFDEQIAFTLRAYRGVDWHILRGEKRPAYGNPALEADTAQEQDSGDFTG